MLIKPHLTEKSLSRSRQGRFTFWVPREYGAGQVRQEIENLFSVKVKNIWILRHSGEARLSNRRRKAIKSPAKLAIISLKSGNFDFFDESSTQSESDKTRKIK